jgi:hypothetical protein
MHNLVQRPNLGDVIPERLAEMLERNRQHQIPRTALAGMPRVGRRSITGSLAIRSLLSRGSTRMLRPAPRLSVPLEF